MKYKYFLFAVVFIVPAMAPLYAQDSYRWNLVNALSGNNYEEAEAIIKNNINLMSSQDKRNLVSFAITYSRGETALKTLNLLKNYGINPGSYDLFTAFNVNQNDDVINFLLQNGAYPNGEILLLVMSKQRFNFARQFINEGVDVNYSYPLARSYSDGMTPLHYAARWNNIELVGLLLDKGANINAQNRDGYTALLLAEANGHLNIYNYLLERGASSHLPLPQTSGAAGSIGSANAAGAASGGMSSMLNSQQIAFQRGTYRLNGGALTIRFIGTETAGSISYAVNGRASSGVYRINGNVLTVSMEGRSFIYKVDSNTVFSGNGEVWTRIGE